MGAGASGAKRAAPLVRSRLVVDAAPYLRERGVDVDALLADVGLAPVTPEQKHVTLPVDLLRRWADGAAEAAGDPLLGVHLAEVSRRGTFGIVEFTCRSAPTVREALRRFARYDKLLNGAVEVTFDEREDGGLLVHALPGEPLCVGRVGNEYTVGLLLRELRRATDGAARVESIALAHPAPKLEAERPAVAAALGVAAIRYDAGHNALTFSTAALDLPVTSADDALLTYLEEHAEREVVAQATGPTLHATLQRLIREGLRADGPELSGAARALGMSVRTLQRRLAEEATSYQDLVDAVRAEMAIAAVRESDRPLSEIAASLGYSDLRPFLRAFKRWTGQTPTQVRDAAR